MNSNKYDRTFELRPHIFREESAGASHETKLKRLELEWQMVPGVVTWRDMVTQAW